MLEFYNYEVARGYLSSVRLPLSLLVLWLITDNTNHTLTTDDYTFFTDFFDGWSDFHE